LSSVLRRFSAHRAPGIVQTVDLVFFLFSYLTICAV
jgi:hypothetical protein